MAKKKRFGARNDGKQTKLKYTPRTDLTPVEKVVEDDVGRYFAEKLPSLLREYHRRFGHVIDRNNAQELYKPYAESRESRQRLSLATHEPAGALADEVYFAMVAKPAPKAKNVVLFNAGGQGSGKTTSLRYSGKSDQAFIVMDGTMQDFEKSCRNIQMAFAQGKAVHINFVYCSYSKAVGNIIQRACHVQGGRVVNVKRAARGHYQALENIFKLIDRYGGREDFSFSVVDNSGDKPRLMALSELRGRRHQSIDALVQQSYPLVDAYYSANKASNPSLTDDLYRRLQGLPG